MVGGRFMVTVTITVGVTVTLTVGVGVGEGIGLGVGVAVDGGCLAVAVEEGVAVRDGGVFAEDGDLPGTDAAAGHHTLRR